MLNSCKKSILIVFRHNMSFKFENGQAYKKFLVRDQNFYYSRSFPIISCALLLPIAFISLSLFLFLSFFLSLSHSHAHLLFYFTLVILTIFMPGLSVSVLLLLTSSLSLFIFLSLSLYLFLSPPILAQIHSFSLPFSFSFPVARTFSLYIQLSYCKTRLDSAHRAESSNPGDMRGWRESERERRIPMGLLTAEIYDRLSHLCKQNRLN